MSVSVELINFRCHKKGKWNFSQGLCHLKGDTGSGKSTVVRAVRWCLYDCEKRVHPNGKKNAKTSVTLTYTSESSTIVIKRMTSPKRITYTQGTNVWEGDDAQARINEFFGPEVLWHVTSYSPQLTFHPFISHGVTEATRSFYSLVDANDDPKSKISRIEQRLSIIQVERDRILRDLAGRDCNHEVCPVKPHRDLSEVFSSLKSVRDRISTMERELKLSLLFEEMNALPDTSPIDSLEKELVNAKKAVSSFELKQSLSRQLLPLELPFNLNDVDKLIEKEEKRKMNEDLCHPHPYDKDKLDTIIEAMTTRMNQYEENKRIRERRESLERKIKTLNHNYSTILRSVDVLENLLIEVSSRLKSSVGDPCPECGVVLSQGKDGLIVGEMCREEKRRLEMERESLKKELDETRKRDMNERTLSGYQSELASLPHPHDVLWTDDDSSLYYRLKSVVIIPPSHHPISDLQEHKRRLLIHQQYNSLLDVGRSVDEIERDIIIEKRRMELKKELTNNTNLPPSSSLRDELGLLTKERDDITSLAERLQEEYAIYSQHSDCDRIRSMKVELTTLERKISFFSRSFSSAQDLYSSDTQEAISFINSSLNVLIPNLFNEDITINLVGCRNGTKGKATVEPTIYFGDGSEGDTSSMSPGERVRVSIAILLSCYNYRRPLFLLLDEPVHSVGAKWDDCLMDMIRDMTRGSLCILISHNDYGQVDSVLEVTKTFS